MTSIETKIPDALYRQAKTIAERELIRISEQKIEDEINKLWLN